MILSLKNKLKEKNKKAFIVLGIASFVLSTPILANIALAANDTFQQTVNGGNLTHTSAGGAVTMGAITLSGADQTSVGIMPQQESIDARGSGAGWNVVFVGTNFVKSGDATKTIASTGFQVSPTPSVTTVDGNTAPSASSGAMSGSGLTVLSAASDNGMGTYRITPSVSLSVPAETYTGSYAATVASTISTGP